MCLPVLLILCYSVTANAQSPFNWRNNTDMLMAEADSLSLLSQVSFHLEKFQKNDQAYKETWHYTEKQGKVIFFQVHYLIEATEFTESYYINNGALICMEQTQAPYAHYYVDEVIRGERFFVVEKAVKEHITFGKQQFDTRDYPDPTLDCQSRFANRYAELQKNMSELNSIHRGSK